MARQFYMAWDSSNSKTQVQVRLKDAPESQAFVIPTVKHDSPIPAQVEVLMDTLLLELSKLDLQLSDCLALCAGLSSYHRPQLAEELRHALDVHAFKGALKLTGDFEIALWGALGQIPDENGMIPGGAVLISGKGSICFGQAPSGKRQRSGGFGPMLDDAGSGFAIGRDILSALVKSSDKRIGHTLLTDIVFERLQIKSVGELLLLVNSPEYQLYNHAYLAPALDIAVDKGDTVAAEIMEDAAAELLELAKAVLDGLNLGRGDLGLAGGILLNSLRMRERVTSLLKAQYPELHVYAAQQTAVEAALAYASKLA